MSTTKSLSGAWKLRTHLTGVHNHGKECLAFVDVFQWPHNATYPMNGVLRLWRPMDYTPDKLNLQMDNCWRENKNQFVIVFLALLVKRKVSRKVLKQEVCPYIYAKVYFDSLSFLPDDLFSKKVSSRSLCAVSQMVIPRPRSKLSRHSLLYRRPVVWNFLNKTSNVPDNVNRFKISMKKSKLTWRPFRSRKKNQ